MIINKMIQDKCRNDVLELLVVGEKSLDKQILLDTLRVYCCYEGYDSSFVVIAINGWNRKFNDVVTKSELLKFKITVSDIILWNDYNDDKISKAEMLEYKKHFISTWCLKSWNNRYRIKLNNYHCGESTITDSDDVTVFNPFGFS